MVVKMIGMIVCLALYALVAVKLLSHALSARIRCRRSPGTAVILLAREDLLIIRAEGASGVTM